MKISTLLVVLVFCTSAVANEFNKFIGLYKPVSQVTSTIEDKERISHCNFKKMLDLKEIEIKLNFKGEHYVLIKDNKSPYSAKHILEKYMYNPYRDSYVYGGQDYAGFRLDYFIPQSSTPRQKLRVEINRTNGGYNFSLSETYFRDYRKLTSKCVYEVNLDRI
jgi:hypothetical protein